MENPRYILRIHLYACVYKQPLLVVGVHRSLVISGVLEHFELPLP